MQNFTFIDLFAGIGGIRKGFEQHGGTCIFTSEIDKYARMTYQANFRDDKPIAGDIRQISEDNIPDHDVLLAGFPCQPFSVAGVSKKKSLGKEHGFACQTYGTLFFEIARILRKKRPVAFMLENVKNLVSHDGGKTFDIICNVLLKELGYQVFHKVIDACCFVPQHRERVIIVGFRTHTNFTWDQLRLPDNNLTLRSILHTTEVNEKYTLSDKLWQYLQDYAAKHKAKGNGFGFGLFGPDDVARTLSARYYKDGSEILIKSLTGKNPRRLTPRECARLMGYDEDFQIPVSDTQGYKQLGNSVVVPLITEVARIMLPHIIELKILSKSSLCVR